MKKIILCLLGLLFILVSCDNNPCNNEVENWRPPVVHTVYFSPKKAKVGDTVMMVIEKDNWNCTKDLDYNKDFEITDDRKIKYIGTHSDINSNYPDDESRMRGCITKIYSEQNDNASYVEVTEYISIRGLVDSAEEGRDVVLIEFKVPTNAKSGYIWTTDPMRFAWGGFSDGKLIIVDENGNEITE